MVAPIEGGVDKAEIEFSFEMKVNGVYEDPRVTKTYSNEGYGEIIWVGTAWRAAEQAVGGAGGGCT